MRHRRGYRDKTQESRVRESTLATLLYGSQGNSLGVEVEFGAPRGRNDGTFLVPLTARVPLSNVTLIGQENWHRG